MKKHYRKENDCLNCGAELQGKFCHVCGQENLQIKESFGHMMNHAISDYFHFDHQFFHTLRPLLFEPGKLTNEYMAGHRVQYLHPVKMYIFISLIYFLLFFKTGTEIVKVQDTSVKKEQLAKVNEIINKKTDLTPKQKASALANINTYKIVKKGNKIDTIYTTDSDDVLITTSDTSYQQYLNDQKKLPVSKQDNFISRYLKKKSFAWRKNKTNSKELVKEGLIHNTPKLMFLLLPLFALLLKITFWKNKKFYVEHLIYSFHFHCFLFLFLTIIMLVQMGIPTSMDTNLGNVVRVLAFVVIIRYLYKSLRIVYNRSPIRTITKMVGLSFSYITLFGIFMLSLIVIIALIEI